MKKVSKRKNNKKEIGKIEKFQAFITNEKTLLVIFILLAILVLFLFIRILKVRKEKAINPAANIIVPVLEKNQVVPFNIDAYRLANNEEEYVIKITNYSGSKVANEEYDYKIEVDNYSNSDISITKENDNKNLIDEKTTIEGKLKKGKKDTIYYHVKITKDKGIKEKELIGIRVTS